jgi:hypothetical protein
VITGIFFLARNRCTTSNMWLDVLLRYRKQCPCHVLLCYLWNEARNLCKTCTQKWPVTLCPGSTNSRWTKLSMSKNSGNFLTAPRTFQYKFNICRYHELYLCTLNH